jgi:Zn-dependent membrane protease YugP
MILSLVGMGMVFLPQLWVKSTVATYRKVDARNGMTGEELARAILRRNNIEDVAIQAIEGDLTDHYDPTAKAVRLSADNYYGKSISGLAIAAPFAAPNPSAKRRPGDPHTCHRSFRDYLINPFVIHE